MARPSEDELIARHLAPLAGPGGLGLLDDAALLQPRPGYDLVLTVDAIVAGVHFRPDDPPGTIAAKGLGVNVSDLAAKGATPTGFLLALALPGGWTENWLERFCRGLGEAADALSCPLLGGDTVRAAGPLVLSITALGEVPPGRMVRRTTARAGDAICVTGTIGDAVLGLDLLALEPRWSTSLGAEERARLVARYRVPQPRLALVDALRDLAHAAMDVSDGLVGDAAKLLRASRMSGSIELGRAPFSGAARSALAAEPGLRDRLVTGGDDYEIVFTLPPQRLAEMRSRAAEAGVPVTHIGEVVEGEGPMLVLDRGLPYAPPTASFQHF